MQPILKSHKCSNCKKKSNDKSSRAKSDRSRGAIKCEAYENVFGQIQEGQVVLIRNFTRGVSCTIMASKNAHIRPFLLKKNKNSSQNRLNYRCEKPAQNTFLLNQNPTLFCLQKPKVLTCKYLAKTKIYLYKNNLDASVSCNDDIKS